MTASTGLGESLVVYSTSLGPETKEDSSQDHAKNSTQQKTGCNSVLRSRSEKLFFSPKCIKKISSFLSMFCLGMSRGVFGAQQ